MQLPTQPTHQYHKLNEYVSRVQGVVGASAAASLVIQNGKVVTEWYRGFHDASKSQPITPTSKFNVASVRKSYLGLAVSLAVTDGKIRSIDDPITHYVSRLDKELYRGTTIRHLLTHTDGVKYRERLFPAGTDWAYNNSGVTVLTDLVTQLYQCSLAQFLDKRVFQPYGFKETGWQTRPTGDLVWQNEFYVSDSGTEANLFVSARELAYWGYLHLVGGQFGDNQSVDPDAFRQAVTVQTPDTLAPRQPRNGFLWVVQHKPSSIVEIGESLPTGAFQMLGVTGCACLVIPQQGVVAVRMYNQSGPNPEGYDYLQDIKAWGNLVLDCSYL